MTPVRIVIFAKAPVPGRVKTRLIPALGADGAAALAGAMLDHTLQQALAAGLDAVELCMSPAPGEPAWHGVAWPAGVECTAQGDGDLGSMHLREAIAKLATENAQRTIRAAPAPTTPPTPESGAEQHAY